MQLAPVTPGHAIPDIPRAGELGRRRRSLRLAGERRGSARDLGDRAAVGARRRAASRVLAKEMPALDERAREFIAASPLLVMATTGADGSCDAGPEGRAAGFRARALGHARARPRVPRQPPLRRRAEPRRAPGRRLAVRRARESRRRCASTASPGSRATRRCSLPARSMAAGRGSSSTSMSDRSSATAARPSSAAISGSRRRGPTRGGAKPQPLDRRPRRGRAAREAEVRREVEAYVRRSTRVLYARSRRTAVIPTTTEELDDHAYTLKKLTEVQDSAQQVRARRDRRRASPGTSSAPRTRASATTA